MVVTRETVMPEAANGRRSAFRLADARIVATVTHLSTFEIILHAEIMLLGTCKLYLIIPFPSIGL